MKNQVYRPFPWNHLPDKVAIVWAIFEIILVAPPMLFLIATVTFTWWAMLKIYHNSTTLQKIPEKIRSFNRVIGKIMLRDPRDHSYIPWIVFLAIYPPSLLYFFYKRQYDFHCFFVFFLYSTVHNMDLKYWQYLFITF